MALIIKKLAKDPVTVASELTVKELESVIKYAADKYYNIENIENIDKNHIADNSVLDDEVYDLLVDFLRIKNPKSKVLTNIGAKVKSKNKVKLDYWLGSMDKIKPTNISQFDMWIKKYKYPYYLSDKLDGISALLTYTTDENIKLFTRGTAKEGHDITHLVQYLNLPSWSIVNKYVIKNKLKTDYNKNIIAFRGELIIPMDIFKKKWSTLFKNARNTVGGLINSKTINSDLAKDISLVLYEVVDPFLTIEKQINTITHLNFKLVHFKKTNNINFELLSEYLKDRRLNGDYLIDGIIVTNNDLHERNTDGNPEYAFAFKDILEDQKAISKIIEIEWNVSKNGYLKPTVIIEPVSIGGVQIQRITANNAKHVVDNGLGKNAIIEVIRSGDVIPKIQNVIKSVKPDMPLGEWHWNDTKVDIISNNNKSSEIIIKNMYSFFSTLNTKGLGEKNVEKLYNAGFTTIEKILLATIDDLLTVPTFKEKTASNLVTSIKSSLTNIKISTLMTASNKLGEGIGEKRLEQVLETYPNLLLDYKKWSKSEFIEKLKILDGWNDKTSSTLVNNFNDFIKFYEKIKSYITLEKKKVIKESKLTGLTMVLSGFRDASLQEKLENSGVKITNTVSKNTTYLVVKDQTIIDEPTGKVKKAMDTGVKIITKNKLLMMIK
jgi:DNA ligase (NAD+)